MKKVNINDGRPVIVGGGIAGLTAGLILCKQGQRPVIIEASDYWGGLLRSEIRPPFGSFDIGSHVISETGINDLDKLLFDHVDVDDYCLHESLPNGTFFKGVSSDSGFIDTRALSPELYELGLSDFLQTQPRTFNLDQTALDVAQQRFGKTFTEYIIAPVLKRLFGEDIDELNSRALHLIGMRRLLVGEEVEAIRWKRESAWNDERMCYRTVQPNNKGLRHYYPKVGGVGKWVLDTLEELRKSGADLFVSTKLKNLSLEDGKVVKVALSNGNQVQCEQLVWCAPVYPLFELSGQAPPTGLKPPRLCAMALTDLVLSHPSPAKHTYMTSHDPNLKTFRVTNYQALEQRALDEPARGYRFTVEEMRPILVNHSPSDIKLLFEEMCVLGMADPKSTIIQSWQSHVSNGFPVPTTRFISDSFKLAQSALDLINNLKIVGRGSGRVFFTSEVLIDLYEQLSL